MSGEIVLKIPLNKWFLLSISLIIIGSIIILFEVTNPTSLTINPTTTKIVFIVDNNCTSCYNVFLNEQILRNFGFNYEKEVVEWNSEKGKQLIQKYNITVLPTYIILDLPTDNQLRQVWSQVGRVVNNVLVFDKVQIFQSNYEKITPNGLTLINYWEDYVKNAVRISVNTTNAHFKGVESAPVTVVEFSDFECPFCARFYSPTLSQLLSEYVDTGKVKFVYKHFPLVSIHPHALKAAEASECAAEQGAFWEYHDKLFENQQFLTVQDLKKYAENLGLNTDQFNDCLDSGKYYEKVQQDLSEGQKSGVTGTPAFFINGILLSGAQPFETFQKIIETELNRLNK